MYLRSPLPGSPRHSNPLAGVALAEGIDAMGYEEARRLLVHHYDEGARTVLFALGADEWLPERGGLSAIMTEARQLGFLKISYCTRGLRPIVPGGDETIVLIDGPPSIHDALHGDGAFDIISSNLARAQGPGRVIAHITVSLLNIRVFEESVAAAAALPGVDTVTFDFATHHQTDDSLGPTQKAIVASLALQLKKRRKPIGVLSCVLNRFARMEPVVECPAWMSLHALPDASQKAGCAVGPSDDCRLCGGVLAAERALLVRGDVRLFIERAWDALRRCLFAKRQKDALARKKAKDGPAAL